jgi:hypothetical protein
MEAQEYTIRPNRKNLNGYSEKLFVSFDKINLEIINKHKPNCINFRNIEVIYSKS